MKQYTSFLHFILLLAVIMTSCNLDDTYTDSLTTNPDATKPLYISVNRTKFLTDGKDAETRVTHDSNYDVIEFKNDDRIGIIGISGNNIIFNNYQYKYNNGNWEAISDFCYAQANTTYIAYYPYNSKMSGKRSEKEILDAFEIPVDQKSTKDENDLMAATINVTASQKQITFNMRHLLSLLVLQTPTYKYKWDNTKIPITLHYSNISGDDEFNYNGITYTTNQNTKYLLVKPGENLSIEAKRWENGYRGIFTCKTTGVSTTANCRHKIKLDYTLLSTDGNMVFVKGDPFYKTSSNFGFPYPQEWKDKPSGCTKIGTIVNIGKEFNVVIKDRGEETKSTDNQTYTTINNENLTTVRGYVASEETVYDRLLPWGDEGQAELNKIPKKELDNNIHGFSYTYQYYTKSMPYIQYLQNKDKHPSNTSKWFIPGVAEMNVIGKYKKEQNYWTCDRKSDQEIFYVRYEGFEKLTIGGIKYDERNYCNAIFMLAF
ncbi:fimbrillin family protein [Bacteroides oleiciplenus]|uniref:Fimbrillin family protein n=1 Tax=Bacteroides oleiciplenus TaxID=626931 RepID=A0A3E5B861_9BACE|nr:fimbrillin family protein [Bacteroides oleiciplenus]RGN33771.1 hypothetical protein DXB65_14890 [Bacteroides oleiciplenus]